jgi:4-amino-4-deoxy-L-arabinose transferase-like glycosyltransferase
MQTEFKDLEGFSSQESKKRLVNFLLLVAVFLLIALPRWLIVSQSATADETKWVARAANFFTALREGNLADTYQSEHPGVTTMWAGALGLNFLFTEHVFQSPGQLAPYELDLLLRDQGYTPLQALVAARRVMVLFNTLILTLVFVYARRLLDLQTALLAAVFFALSPFFIAHTHLMHLDGLAGSLMTLSLLAFLGHLGGGKWPDLLLSGTAAGLAWLTKIPAISIAPILAIIALITIWQIKDAKDRRAGSRKVGISFIAWAFIALSTFFLLWPAMWVTPLNTLSRIFQEAMNYAGGGHGDPVFFNGTIYSNGRIPAQVFTFYPITYLWRSTPVVLLGLALVIPGLWKRWPSLNRLPGRRTISALLLYALLFTFFMNLGDKKFDRYLIPIYPALQLVSAAGWTALLRQIARHWPQKTSKVSAQEPATVQAPKTSQVWMLVSLVLLAGWLLFSLWSVFPYPLSYYNSLLGGSEKAIQVMQIGWGEGLDEAGRYLSQKAGSDTLNVASWYRSVLAYHFNGNTLSINAQLTQEEEAAILSADYAVLYIHQWQRDIPPKLLDEFSARNPEHTIEINGLEYVRVYNLKN